jgi:hypothetical protein
MRNEYLHVTDDELLLYAGEEVGSSSDGRIRAHLESCPQCRARLKELESTLAEFGEAHRKSLKAALPDGSGPRALLKARLGILAAEETGKESHSTWIGGRGQSVALASIAIAACLLVAIRLRGPAERPQSMTALGHRDEPDLRLTPGATVPVTEGEICGAAGERALPAVPASLKRKVFEEYGVTPPRPDAYEVDYLITPELGGATDIRNLWPEPYQDTLWNAHVKDQLEDRLHRMVCHGDLDLITAQRDISTDWIAAYRKYFHVDKPLSDDSSLNLSMLTASLPRT